MTIGMRGWSAFWCRAASATVSACAKHIGAASDRENVYSCSGTGNSTVAFFASGERIESALLAFFLVTVVLSTAVAGRAGNLALLAIGMTLTFNIVVGGALTGAPFNPARALGPMVATGKFDDAWLYLLAPIVGAIVAAIVHTAFGRLAQKGLPAGQGRAAQTAAE